MAKYQLWKRDEYGQCSIIGSPSEKLDEIVKRAKDEVTELNVNNALTVDDKKRNWECYFVEPTDGSIYAGFDSHNKNIIYKTAGKKDQTVIDGKFKVRIFLGTLDKKAWYGTDARNKEMDSVAHQDLVGKTVYFVKQI